MRHRASTQGYKSWRLFAIIEGIPKGFLFQEVRKRGEILRMRGLIVGPEDQKWKWAESQALGQFDL